MKVMCYTSAQAIGFARIHRSFGNLYAKAKNICYLEAYGREIMTRCAFEDGTT